MLYLLSWKIHWGQSANKTFTSRPEMVAWARDNGVREGSMFEYVPDDSGISILTHIGDVQDVF